MEHHCPIEPGCDLVGLPRSKYYYQSQRKKEQKLVADLELVCCQLPTYGTWRITHQLRYRPYGYEVNRKHTQRIMRQFGLLQPTKRRKCRTSNSAYPYPHYPNLVEDLEITHPDQVCGCVM